MKPVFADTSYFLALHKPLDEAHDAAREAGAHNARPLVVSEYVLIALGSALSRAPQRRHFVRALDGVRSDPRFQVVAASAPVLEDAVAMFRKHHDKDWSLTDCTSFVIMKRMGLRDALTADHHFIQAGFRALLSGGLR